MKHILYQICVPMTLLLVASSFGTLAQSASGDDIWNPVGNRGFTPPAIQEAQMEFDVDGYPVVAYIDPTTDKPTVKKWNGIDWAVLGMESFTAGPVDFLKLQIGPIGEKYLALNSSGTITTYHWDGIQWSAIAGVHSSMVNEEHKLLINQAGDLFLAYVDLAPPNSWRYPKVLMHDATWTTIGVPGFSEVGPVMMDMAMAGGQFYFGVSEGAFGNEQIGIYSYGTQGWTLLDDPVLHNTHYTFAMAGSNYGDLFLAYRDADNNHKLTVRQWNGGSWVLLGPPAITDDYVSQIDLEVNALGRPVVVAVEAVSRNLRAFEWNGSLWSDISPASLDMTNGFIYASFLDLEFGQNGPYVAARDLGVNGAASVFTHVGGVGQEEYASKQDFRIWPNPSSGAIWLQRSSIEERVRWRVMDVSGKVICSGVLEPGVDRVFTSISEDASGLYFVEIVSERSREVRKLIIVP